MGSSLQLDHDKEWGERPERHMAARLQKARQAVHMCLAFL